MKRTEYGGMCLSSQLQQEAKNKRILASDNVRKKEELMSRIIRAEKTRGVTQTVECLPRKCKVLSSNSNTAFLLKFLLSPL
jgi:hypothetical protein